jgi:hypothetical protein
MVPQLVVLGRTKSTAREQLMAKFERDIIIANDDGKVYHITQDQLVAMEPVSLTDDRYQLVKGLLNQGVSVAAIPTRETGPEPDIFCFLLNLGSLKKVQPDES